MAADSRGSYLCDNGDRLATTDDCRKIYKVGDKVIFTSGIYPLMKSIIVNFEQSKDQSISTLSEISRKVYEVWKIVKPEKQACDNGRAVEMMIGTVENGKCVIYVISSYDNDFIPQRYEGTNSVVAATMGSTEALSDLCDIIDNKYKGYINNKAIDFYQMFLDIYARHSYEGIGGYMHFFTINPKGINPKCKAKIPDSRDIKRINIQLDEHCNPKTGFKIAQNMGTSNNPLWANRIYIDTDGNIAFSGRLKGADGIFSGTVEAGTIESSIINGSIINGSEINGGTINVDTDVTVGNSLRIGSPTDSDNKKTLYFNNSVNFSTYSSYIPGQYNLSLSCNRFELYGVSALDGEWHFSNADVTGLENSGYLKGSGVSGSFESADGKVITISNGQITNIV